MKRFSVFFPATFSALMLLAGAAAGAREPLSPDGLRALEAKVKSVSASVSPTTVALLSEKTGSSGSGVIVDKDGLILTAAHVVQGTPEVTVVFPDGKQVPGKVLGANYSKDIAMVRMAQPGPWPSVPLGESRPLRAGDYVISLGHSAGFDPSRTPPVRFGRVMSKGPGNFLTTDCTLIGGDSGGPLFDLDGKLVGIHSSIARSWSNNNHAGIDGYKEDWDRMLAGESWGTLQMNPLANPDMPVLGIGMGMMRGGSGVIVDTIAGGSPAAAAGVRRGDVIVKIDNIEIPDGDQLLQAIAKRNPGEVVNVGILRDGKLLDFPVTLKSRKDLYQGE